MRSGRRASKEPLVGEKKGVIVLIGFLMIRRPPRSTLVSLRRQRQMCIRDSHYRTYYAKRNIPGILQLLNVSAMHVMIHLKYHGQNSFTLFLCKLDAPQLL